MIIYIVGLFNGLKVADAQIRVPLIEKIEWDGSDLEVAAKAMAGRFQADVRVRRMLILNEGSKHYFKMRDIPNQDGYKSGTWEWVEFNSQITYLMVQDPMICTRCSGRGVVSWGRVNHMLWHGTPIRGCFGCGTAGFVLE